MTAFTWSNFTGVDPAFIDMDRDTDIDTALFWTLHVRVTPFLGSDDPEEFMHRIVNDTRNVVPWTHVDEDWPAACGGDSFTAWCVEFPYTPEDDKAVHVYFTAPNVRLATTVGVAFMARTGLDITDVALSTGGDWAAQVTLPPVIR